MAYLIGQSISLAAANWSDATGFADNAALEIRDGQQTISAGLDQSALTEGVSTIDVGPGFSGNIGGPSGSLKCDVDGSGTPQFRYAAAGGSLYYEAKGDNNLCVRFVNSSSARAYLTGGTFTTLELNSGYTEVSDSVTLSSQTVNLTGGTLKCDAVIGTLNQWGGNAILTKAPTTWIQWGGTGVHDSASGNITTFSQGPNGHLDHRGGNIATFTIAGSFTLANATRAGTLAGTAGTIVITTAKIVDTSPTAGITWTAANITKLGKGVGSSTAGGGPI